ncbi:class I SAM-dependent methyltransferase [Paenibacillus sp. NPDC057934]|uniref:class I SAM-dependent methyltransferase n=1 Tax=Paenibacillus sp. NPDC057934 TaxID=3346282 RepID=UPI0036D8B348
MLTKISQYSGKPELYRPSTDKFWDDEHISKGMLEAHLNPDWDAATRKADFLEQSVSWISSIAPPKHYSTLLDLGCGPGLYAERFHKAGYSVTGIDYSKRSIAYAQEQSTLSHYNIQYHYQDYLDLEYSESFDVITLIYCDYGVMSTEARFQLLDKVFKALKPNGKFILDVFTPAQHEGEKEKKDWEYSGDGGFWSDQPHLCLNSFYRYNKEDTVLNQTIVIHESSIHCYNIWDHYFTENTLMDEMRHIGFSKYELYGDVAGKEYSPEGNMICAVLTK